MIGIRRRKGFHYRHIGRYGEIVSVLVKYGFGDLLSRLNVERYLSAGQKFIQRRKRKRLEGVSRWDRVRLALEELGPTFIKLGQFASNRPDVLPHELVTSLERLQDDVPPFPEQDAVDIIEKELGQPIQAVFKEFSRKPFASASIAQVHRAVLQNGDLVAVKVQRPRIAETITIDLEIMYHLASLIEKHVQGIEVFDPIQFVDEFADAIKKEIDFTIEELHFEIFFKNFQDDEHVYVPRVYKELTSQRVIVTEFVKGIKITNLKALVQAGLDPKIIAQRGAGIVLKQIFTHGFFHADPHPGNILVIENNKICILDLGMTGILTPSSRDRLSTIIIGVANRDPKRIVKVLYEMSMQLEGKDELEYEIAGLLQEYASKTLRRINVGEVLNRLARLLAKYRIQLIPGFYLLAKALVTVEGTGYRLDPDFNMLEHLRPFAERLIHERYSPKSLARETVDTTQDMLALLRDLPTESREIIQLIKRGKIHFEFEHRGLDPMLRKLDQLVNRLVYGLVLAALVVGSSIVVLSNIPPKLYGLPLIGVAGFLAAVFMGFWLLISILRHEKM